MECLSALRRALCAHRRRRYAAGVRARRSIGLALHVLAATSLIASAHAQPRGTDTREAERLFEKGKAEFQAKTYADACEDLASSERLEPTVGTLGLLAACHEAQQRLATAYREYLEVAA